MAGPKFDVTTEKGLAAFNGFMAAKSYVEGWSYTAADSDTLAQFQSQLPDRVKYPHAYRWYVHIAALQGIRGLHLLPPVGAPAPAVTSSAPAPAKAAKPAAPAAPAPAPAPAAAPAEEEEEEDDFDVFGDDDEDDDKPREIADPDAVVPEDQGGDGKETRAQMLARLKKEAEERTAKKEAKQRTLVAIEVKPWSIEQDLMALWKKITETVVQDGLKWGESCTLADVAFGIKKIQCTFVMGVNNSSDEIIEKILDMEDDVQSAEVTSMNVL